MSKGIEIGGAGSVANPEPFLSRGFETGIVAPTLGTQGIYALKMQAFPITGKSVVRRDVLVFRTATVFLPLFQFLWLPGPHLVLDCLKGQQNF